MVGIEAVKAYLRLETPEEDALLATLVAAAEGMAERFLGAALVVRDVVETVPAGVAAWRLAQEPVVAVTAIADRAPGPGAVAIGADGTGRVRVEAGPAPVAVRYRAGMAADAGGVPAPIAQGIVRLAAHLFAHRDDEAGPPAAVAALWRPYRRMRL